MSKFARIREVIRGEAGETPAAPASADSPPAPAAPMSAMDRAVARPLVSRQTLIIGGAAAALFIVFAFGYVRFGLSSSLAVDGERIMVAEVTQAAFREYIPVTGNVAPARTVYLDAVEGGQVTDVLAEEGQMVEAGQPLLELKNTNLQLQVVEAESRLTEQVNNLNTSRLSFEQNQLRHQRDLIDISQRVDTLQRDLARGESLLAVDAIPRREVEDLRTQLQYQLELRTTVTAAQRVDREMQTQQTAQLQSAVDRISANLEIARENLANLVMKAPITGQLTVFEANLGESKTPSQRIGQIDDIAAFKVTALVDEFYLGRVAIGQTATAPIGGQTHTLQVSKVYPDVRERQFQVDLEFTGGAPDGVRRGQTLRMDLEIGAAAQSRVVANGPWVDDTGGTWAFVLGPEGNVAHRRALVVGRRNPDMVEIQSGLADGERIIVSSYQQMMDFDRVSVRGTPGGAPAPAETGEEGEAE